MSVDLHGVLGWATIVVVLVASLHARSQVRSGREYHGGLHRGAVVLVDVLVLVGLLVWVDDRWWEVEGMFTQAWIHPALGLATLALGHIGIKRAQTERWAAEAYAIASRALFGVAVLLGASAAVAIAW